MKQINMKIILLVTSALFGISAISEAQHSSQVLLNDNENIEKITKGGGGYYVSKPIYDGVDGSPFLFEEKLGKVYKGGKPSSKDYFFTYDVSKKVILIRDSKHIFELNPDQIDYVLLEGRKFVFIKGSYYELLTEGEFLFLKQYSATLQKPNYNPALGSGNRNNEWKITAFYYLNVQGDIRKISLSGKSLKKALSDQTSFAEWAEEKKIKIGDEKDVINVLSLYSTSK